MWCGLGGRLVGCFGRGQAEENGCGKNANMGMTYRQGLEELEEMTTWENEVKYLCA